MIRSGVSNDLVAPAIISAALLFFLFEKELLYQKSGSSGDKNIGYDALDIHYFSNW